MFVDVREPWPDGKLLCRYDPDRNLLEFREGKRTITVDLENYIKFRETRIKEEQEAQRYPAA